MKRPSNSPVTYEVMNEGKLVLEYWQGSVTRSDVEFHERQHLTNGLVASGASVFVDARAASFGIKREEVQDVVDGMYAAFANGIKIGKCAILVNDRTYELAKAYEQSAAKYGINAIIFTSFDVACKWLGVEEETVRTYLDRARSVRPQ